MPYGRQMRPDWPGLLAFALWLAVLAAIGVHEWAAARP